MIFAKWTSDYLYIIYLLDIDGRSPPLVHSNKVLVWYCMVWTEKPIS